MGQGPAAGMVFVVIFLLNAALSFGLSLVVAALLGPASFGQYALALSVSVVVNTALFEWLRLSVTRFCPEAAGPADPSIRATLLSGYGAVAALSVFLTFLLLLAPFEFGIPSRLAAAALVAGLGVGLFDYATALARALFRDRLYAAIVAGRGMAVFAVSVAAALLIGDPASVLAASAVASLAAAGAAAPALADPAARFRERSRLWATRFARYGLPLVAASAIYQLIPFLNRAVLASRAGFTEAGHLALTTELATRLFQNLGSALDLALFQLAVRAERRDGPDAGARAVSSNLAVVVAVLLPAAAGLLVVWPSFEALFVPAAFRGRTEAVAIWAVPALAAYGLVQYGLNPVFQLRHRTVLVIGAAAAALAVDALLVLALPDANRPETMAAFQLAAFGTALATLAAAAALGGARLPWRDAGLAAAGSATMAALLWPFREAAPAPILLPALAAVGSAFYGAFALATNLAGCRKITLARFRVRR